MKVDESDLNHDYLRALYFFRLAESVPLRFHDLSGIIEETIIGHTKLFGGVIDIGHTKITKPNLWARFWIRFLGIGKYKST